MNTHNKQFRLLLSGFIILLLINLILLFLLFQNYNSDEIESLERIQLRMDSLDQRLENSRFRIDSVLTNINNTLDLSRQLDEQVIDLSTGYEKDKARALKKIQQLKEQIRQENIRLQNLQHELKSL
ncbi:MAG: hypothetical protein AB9842_03010 [Bacteroidales bacterium]